VIRVRGNMLQAILRAAGLVALVSLCGCSDINSTAVEPSAAKKTSGAPTALRALVQTPRAGNVYAIKTNDQLRIQVYNEPTITGDYQIDGAGFLSIPLAGHVKAAGLTRAQLEDTIANRLNKSGVLNGAHVNVQITSYGPFYIRGEVKHPGEFPYKPGLTVLDAVALAGGYTYRADETSVFVRSPSAPDETVYSLNANVPVTPGDNLRIPERWF
jgi:protein involved in polysaccharide export with SLBB domain